MYRWVLNISREGDIFRWAIRKNVFPERVAKHWNRLPREVIEAACFSYLKVVWTWRFGTRYGDAVGSVGFAVGLDDTKDLFQPK